MTTTAPANFAATVEAWSGFPGILTAFVAAIVVGLVLGVLAGLYVVWDSDRRAVRQHRGRDD